MRIAKDEQCESGGEFHTLWNTEGLRLMCEYGVIVDNGVIVDSKYSVHKLAPEFLAEIWYEISRHRFECLKDARKALDMKSFL